MHRRTVLLLYLTLIMRNGHFGGVANTQTRGIGNLKVWRILSGTIMSKEVEAK
jgi:hypothetical protein